MWRRVSIKRMPGLWPVALRAVLEGLAVVGVDPDVLCRRCGIDRARLNDPLHRVPLEQAGRVWPEATRLWGRPGIGLSVGAAMPFGALEALDYTFATAGTVALGLKRIAHAFDVVTGGATRMRLHHGPDELSLVFQPLPMDDLRDYGVALSVQRLAWAGVVPARVTLKGGPVAPREEYREKLGCPVHFGADASAVVIRAAHGARQLPVPLPGLQAIVDRDLSAQLSRSLEARDLLDDVRREVMVTLTPGGPTMGVIARRLGMGARTLQRQLAARDTTFTRLVDQTRRTMALEHLHRGQLSVAEIAFLLGFSESSAFSRAVRRWTGVWPVDVRARGT